MIHRERCEHTNIERRKQTNKVDTNVFLSYISALIIYFQIIHTELDVIKSFSIELLMMKKQILESLEYDYNNFVITFLSICTSESVLDTALEAHIFHSRLLKFGCAYIDIHTRGDKYVHNIAHVCTYT